MAGYAGLGDDGTCFGVESEAELDGEFLRGEGLEGADDGVGGGSHGGECVVEPFVELGDDIPSPAADLLRAGRGEVAAVKQDRAGISSHFY